MTSSADLSSQPDTVQQQPPLAKENNHLIWKVIFTIVFIFDTKIVYLYFRGSSWYFDVTNLLRVSFWLLPIVSLLLFLETFRKKTPRTFNKRIWVIICSLLIILNTLYVCWIWLSYSLSSNVGMSILFTAPPALALTITDFIAGFFYFIQEQCQGITRVVLIAFLAIVSFAVITFGVLGFPLIILYLFSV
jgi:hypothetical protein